MNRYEPSSNAIQLFRREVVEWHSHHGRHFPWRRRSASNYKKIIAEILLQRTRAETVARFFPTFVNRYPSWSQLAKADENELIELIRPVGLWRRRSTTLINLAVEMAKRNGRFPKGREAIEALPGVGQYIANSIMLLCQDSPQPLLDTNMARVLERYFGPRKLSDIRYDPYLQRLATMVINCGDAVVLNWAILDFGAKTCLIRSPKCSECPLVNGCLYAGQHKTTHKGTSLSKFEDERCYRTISLT